MNHISPDNPLHPDNIQILIFELQSVIKLLIENHEMKADLYGLDDTGDRITLTLRLIDNNLDVLNDRFYELNNQYGFYLKQ